MPREGQLCGWSHKPACTYETGNRLLQVVDSPAGTTTLAYTATEWQDKAHDRRRKRVNRGYPLPSLFPLRTLTTR